ncbi:FGGY-family carbohydrate kinase [Claveliimonas bilis]|uniref:FGGY-family carbohydrate kinase n=1 Tax=Claveliimonas bilis TaxID=3028070 RepID=UPI00292D7F37|nr:FGGY-family carbohydrate kinase [Claveliimonas bilis]BDZ79787.1 kinase [Claveliimonas bilis]
MNVYKKGSGGLIGVGIGGIRCCRVLLKKDGTLAQPVISWMDARTAVPYEHTNPEVAYVTSTTGYLSCRLTGEFKDCIGNAFGEWPVDMKTWNWSEDEEVIRKYQIPREMLFEAVGPGEILGHVTKAASEKTGLPEGLPVVSVTNDKAVEGLGAGLVNDQTAVISLGTYITLMIQGKELPKDPKALWAIISSVPGKYLYESYGIRRGMWTVSWFRDLFGDGLVQEAAKQGLSPEELLNKKAEKVPAGSDGLMTVLDWLANPWEPYKKGIMIGFGAHMDEAYMYRSILEGIAYTMKNNCDAMCEELGKPLKEIVISGGGSNSDLFMQIFADIFNVPAKRNVVNESASLGAVINTAVALGEYESYEKAVEEMVEIKDVFMPIEKNAQLYQKLNQRAYKNMANYTDGVLKEIYNVYNEDV